MQIKINEVFESVQGEGHYTGAPMMFIRLSGCTRACDFCDTKYHNQGKFYEVEEIVKKINESKQKIVCWTGGEPLLQLDAITEISRKIKNGVDFHIETNGDLLHLLNRTYKWSIFDFIACSPKDHWIAKSARRFLDEGVIDEVKVVTDLEKVGVDMLEYASTLMPLTTNNKEQDVEIMKKVWEYCTAHQLNYSPRIQYLVWGNKKEV